MPKKNVKGGQTQASQGEPKPSTSHDEPDEDEDHAPQTQASSTQTKKAMSNLSKDMAKRKVTELVQYLLIMDQKKYPIKRTDINKVVLKEHSKCFPVLIEEARRTLSEVYGIELVEVDPKARSYILINKLDQDVDMPLQWSAKDNRKMALIMVILSVIFMKGNVIQDEELYHFLKKLGVDIDAPHETFGDVKKLISTELVRQGYLEVQRQPNSDPPSFEFRWGVRAKHETSKRYVLDFVSQIYDIDNPQVWANQYDDMVQEEHQLEGQ